MRRLRYPKSNPLGRYSAAAAHCGRAVAWHVVAVGVAPVVHARGGVPRRYRVAGAA